MRIPLKLALTSVVAAVFCLGAAVNASASTRFVSPDHNIACVMSKQSVRCDIRKHSWHSPRKPRSCHLDYGSAVAVNKQGSAHFVCAGDSTLGAGPVLPTGHSIFRGSFFCESNGPDEIGCASLPSGHGFGFGKHQYVFL